MQSGIYRIRNLVTGDVYIGSTKDFRKRWNVHRCDLRNKVHHNRHFVYAWHKYGEANFAFEVVERCGVDVLIEREQAWLDAAQSAPGVRCYNLSPVAASGGLSEAGRERIRQSSLGNTHTLGRVRSQEERDRISVGNSGKKRSPESIENYRKAAKLREQRNREAAQAIPVSKPWEV